MTWTHPLLKSLSMTQSCKELSFLTQHAFFRLKWSFFLPIKKLPTAVQSLEINTFLFCKVTLLTNYNTWIWSLYSTYKLYYRLFIKTLKCNFSSLTTTRLISGTQINIPLNESIRRLFDLFTLFIFFPFILQSYLSIDQTN